MCQGPSDPEKVRALAYLQEAPLSPCSIMLVEELVSDVRVACALMDANFILTGSGGLSVEPGSGPMWCSPWLGCLRAEDAMHADS